jgi:hypothetical protein
MLELLGLVALVVLLGAVAVGLLKVLFWAILLPFKVGFWLLKGLVGLVVVVPLLLVALWAASAVLPIVLVVIAVPVIFVVGGVIALFRVFV